MTYLATFHRPLTAADHAAQNTELLEHQFAIESDEGGVKLGPGRWNDLDYVNRSDAEITSIVDAAVLAAIAGLDFTTSGDVAAAIAAALEGFTADATESIDIVCGDRTTPLIVATNVGSRRMPFAFTLSGIRASLEVAQTSGSVFTINVKESGTTILSTLITFDNGELTSFTAATAVVISDPNLADDALITVDVTQIGSGDASGLAVKLIGTKAA